LAAESGATRVCASDINVAAAAETVAAVSNAFAAHVDVTSRRSVEALIQTARREMGGIDVLVTAAGIGNRAGFLDASEDDWQSVMDVNVSGPFRCGQEVARVMAEQGRGGAIVHFSSFVARRMGSGGSVYAASKGAVATLTYAMAVGLARYGIRVNAVLPGPIETGMDVAEAVVFLASDDAAFINGAVVAVDGGLSASR
jgi:3-oxoacyl-[acyl-carrier protein] reductase